MGERLVSRVDGGPVAGTSRARVSPAGPLGALPDPDGVVGSLPPVLFGVEAGVEVVLRAPGRVTHVAPVLVVPQTLVRHTPVGAPGRPTDAPAVTPRVPAEEGAVDQGPPGPLDPTPDTRGSVDAANVVSVGDGADLGTRVVSVPSGGLLDPWNRWEGRPDPKTYRYLPCNFPVHCSCGRTTRQEGREKTREDLPSL